jgi:hypothetical protein
MFLSVAREHKSSLRRLVRYRLRKALLSSRLVSWFWCLPQLAYIVTRSIPIIPSEPLPFFRAGFPDANLLIYLHKSFSLTGGDISLLGGALPPPGYLDLLTYVPVPEFHSRHV